MKIAAVSASVVRPRKIPRIGIPVVEILTDEGLTGWCEAPISEAPHVACDIIRSLLEPALVGRPFLPNRDEIASLWDLMYALHRSEGHTAGFLLEAMSAVDIALWDLAGQITGHPYLLWQGSIVPVPKLRRLGLTWPVPMPSAWARALGN